MIWPGEKQAWALLSELDPKDVERNANVIYDKNLSTYKLICFGQKINISLQDRTISGKSDIAHTLIKEFGNFSRISILNYLVNARNIPLSKQLKRPSDLTGGDIFARGSHVLPLNEIAGLFNNDKGGFLRKGQNMGGTQLDYGDMSLELSPFPRVPIVIIIWGSDEEFAERSSLLFDSSCTFHISTDILWSIAMLTVRLMLHKE